MLHKKVIGKLSLTAFCFTFVCAENFVKEKNPNNESIKEFTIDLEERGTNLTQTVILDKENGLVITDVPAHNDLDPTTSYHDEKLGLTLQVNHRIRQCTIFRPLFYSSITEIETNLKGTSQDEKSPERMVIGRPGDSTIHYHLTEFKCGDAIPLEEDCIPPKLKKHIPPGFPTFVTRILQLPRGDIHSQPGNSSQALLVDPLTQKTYNYGDEVEVCEDSLREILPSCPHRHVSRRKRQAQHEYNEWCRDNNFNRVERCAHRTVSCDSGCPMELIAYDCTNPRQTCSYTIVCSGINNVSPTSRKEDGGGCIRHIHLAGWACDMCCRSTSCGIHLPMCQYMPSDDICPPADKGCPYMNVETKRTGTKSRNKCYIHDDCESVIVGDGRVHKSGIQCDKTVKQRREKVFCCRTDETLSRSEAQNRGNQLPFCT